MKTKSLKIVSLALTLVILSTLFVFASPVSASTNNLWAWWPAPVYATTCYVSPTAITTSGAGGR